MAEGHSTIFYDFKYEVSPPSSSDWVQIWYLGLSFYNTGAINGTPVAKVRTISSTGFDTSISFNVDLYLQNGKHITKINFQGYPNYPYGIYLHYITENNEDIYGTEYYNSGDQNSSSPPRINTKFRDNCDYGFMFFKETPEGNFKTWLENNCQQIL